MLRALKLRNFRNHKSFLGEFSSEGALFLGSNGAGKTSILEAIYYIATLRSFRHSSSRDMVLNGEAGAEILAEADEERFALRLQLLPSKATSLQRNDILLSATQFLSAKAFFAVLFSPEELQLPFAPPRERRRFMNRLFGPLFPAHLQNLRDLEKILASRNALLRRIQENKAKREELEFYDERLATTSVRITEVRKEFFEEYGNRISEAFHTLTGQELELLVRFSPDIQNDPLKTIQEAWEKDIRYGASTRGAHHDDFGFLLNGKPLETVGSRGEVRSALLALKMAEYDYLHTQTGASPVLLLDDVFSELDEERRKHLAMFIRGKQSFLTATDKPAETAEIDSLPVIRINE